VCERVRERKVHNENGWRVSVLYFCVVQKAQPKMGSADGSCVRDVLSMLHYHFKLYFKFWGVY
jgi:hypothetical protein